MVDKKPKVAKVEKPKAIVKETKAETFKRLAETRTKSVLKSLRILGNCSNRANYEYSQEQIEKIDLAITNALVDTMSKFTKSKKEVETFNL